MRLSFDRLAALAGEVCAESPLLGHLFVFHSRRRDRLKILYWDRDGLALWYKRLEKGVFPFPKRDADSLAVSPAELSLLLEGHEMNYSLQGNGKTLEGSQHPDRNAQFEHINDRVSAALREGQPVISVDTKKEGIGRQLRHFAKGEVGIVIILQYLRWRLNRQSPSL